MKKFRQAAFVDPYRFAVEKKKEKKTVALTFLRYPLKGWNFLLIILAWAIFSYKYFFKKYVLNYDLNPHLSQSVKAFISYNCLCNIKRKYVLKCTAK